METKHQGSVGNSVNFYVKLWLTSEEGKKKFSLVSLHLQRKGNQVALHLSNTKPVNLPSSMRLCTLNIFLIFL